MDPALQAESEKLTRSWMRHEAEALRGYLVSHVEDPRLNVQSILTRHFLVRALYPGKFEHVMHEEYRFAAAMNWLLRNSSELLDPEARGAILHGLRQGADNAEGLELPYYLLGAFQTLPLEIAGKTLPNYLSDILEHPGPEPHPILSAPALDTFRNAWARAFASAPAVPRLSVFEPACGSANDYRFIAAYGLAPALDYTGMDLCSKNVENARQLFPAISFQVANAFSIPARDRHFALCVVHDLFEHLSLAGLTQAVAEICRCTRNSICAGFFNMREREEHEVVPYEDYHWNALSLARVRELFAAQGFAGQVIHVGRFLSDVVGCDETHNPNAYTFMLERIADAG